MEGGREGTAKAITGWAKQHDVPLVDLKAAVAEQVMSGRGNPDGIHWNFEVHQAVAELMLKALAEAGVHEPIHEQRRLALPLQSGDDAVLRQMRRRYTSATYLRKLEPLSDFQLTTDVIVGFPGEDEPAFARTFATLERAGITKVHVFPYSPRPGTATALADTVPAPVKRERSARLRAWSESACRARWQEKLGREDVVLVDRPGRGYGADYSPWLVDAPVGELVRVRGRAVVEEGILAA